MTLILSVIRLCSCTTVGYLGLLCNSMLISDFLVLIRPTKKELAEFGTPDFTIYNAGQFPANRFTAGMTSTTSVEVNFKRKEMVILGTECKHHLFR